MRISERSSMYTVSIAIPVVDEFHFLRGTIEQIKKYKHPEINQQILVMDQSNTNHLDRAYQSDPDVEVIKTTRIDAGYPIDEAAKIASGEYFCSLDADCWPVHPAYLYAPIKAIEKYKLSFVGKATGLHLSYQTQGNFYHINNYYRVSTTALVRKVAEAVSFMRYVNRYKANFIPNVDVPWTADCDNGVVANWYVDYAKLGPKLSLAMNKKLGNTNEMGVYGMTIDELVTHMVFGYGKEWIGNPHKVLGDKYLEWQNKIMIQGLTNEIIEEIKAAQIPAYQILYDRHYWDGTSERPLAPTDELYADFSAWKRSVQ